MKRGTENKNLVRIGYDKQLDMFEVLISNDGGESWNLDTGCFCKHCKDDKVSEPEYIHIDLISALKKAIACGYEMVY